MSEVDNYLANVEPAERSALDHVRRLAMEVVPDAEDGRSYGMPALKYRKKPLIGFLSAKKHLSLFPFSPAVIEALSGRLDGFDVSKGTIRFSAAHPIPDDVLLDIVRYRQREIAGGRPT